MARLLRYMSRNTGVPDPGAEGRFPPYSCAFAPALSSQDDRARRTPASIRLNHYLHHVVVFVGISERVGNSIILYQRNAAQAHLAVDDGERDRLQALFLAWSVDADAGLDVELCAVPAAFEECAILGEELAAADIEP